MKKMSTFAFLFMIAASANAQVSDEAIHAYIEKHREAGSGPGIVVARADGILTASNKTSSAVVYSYKIGKSRDRSGAQYMVVFVPFGNRYEPKKQVKVGLAGVQTVERIEILDRTITLFGKAWASKDPACCPSREVSQKYVVLYEGLMAKGQ